MCSVPGTGRRQVLRAGGNIEWGGCSALATADLVELSADGEQLGRVVLPNMTKGFFSPAACALGDRVVIAGGSHYEGTFVEAFDFGGGGSWLRLPSLHPERFDHVLGVSDGRLVIASKSFSFSMMVDAYDPREGRWTAVSRSPYQLHHEFLNFCVVGDAHSVLAIGWCTPEILGGSTRVLDMRTNKWLTTIPLWPRPRSYATTCVLGSDVVMLVGGIADRDNFTADSVHNADTCMHRVGWVDAFDLHSNQWSEFPDTLTPHAARAVCVL
eukprot:TRINITY_DN2680_c0_g1_i10.p1 TRINITY_DN2680_c0_g1~~TRINITY_DN2680_c0_g1_i10.p1  ORF type:complete len:269 (-),score=39.14 TRINITY_DN2680_c0_g1_i10:272-1078(-)